MLRKTLLALAATAALGLAAFTPTSASAHWHGGWHGGWGHHHHFWGGPRFYFGGPAYVAYNPCLRRRWVPTPYGLRLRLVNVCY